MTLVPREVTLIGAKECRVQRRLYTRGSQAVGHDPFWAQPSILRFMIFTLQLTTVEKLKL